MKHIIIGTAGHIDHGKTTLIRALTGRDTDRLKEEKKRGISIDLGFTHFDLPSGKRAGIIDVPGHEKFIRNMLAGVGGMDIVMLVIAADEGVMPQTREHLDILSQLKIKKGVIVLTKVSLVDSDWLELIKEDIREKVQGTFLAEAEILMVDSIKGTGIQELVEKIDCLTEETESRDIQSPARMAIDRVFTITGFGTVVTGTLIEGKITVEETLEILPDHVKVRIRNIQVHGKSVETAYAGQRVAINLANVKKEDIERGQILVQVNSMETTMMLDGKIQVLKNYPRKLQNRDRVRLYHGSTEILARVALLDQEELGPGDTGLVQLRLEEETAVKKGDHIVVRFYSPMETIGGFVVIDSNPKKHRRFNEEVIQELKMKEKGTPEEILEKKIESISSDFPDVSLLAKMTGQQSSEIHGLLEPLVEKNRVLQLEDDYIIHIKYYEKLKKQIIELLSIYHQENPLRKGILKEELKSKVFPKKKAKVIDALIEVLQKDEVIKVSEKFVALYHFEIQMNETQHKIKDKIIEAFLREPYSPPKIEDVIKELNFKKQEIDQVVEILIGNELIRLNAEIIIDREALKKAQDNLITFIKEKGSITLAEFRDMLDTSRKYAVAILEYFDNNKITKRNEDTRVLY
ncbi:selenocysteine-specific translation elongation factor [Alkaliphilus transvaalensis]|uniref:selenocysteine-specific translation elongation factor n=1 Tax=Alkaliphilus transvaalensis TaxID=114628 RepID=UPI00047B874B|nr:selenocysteine-specific translation elongation factor [Alkaliphilus transvaalensis]